MTPPPATLEINIVQEADPGFDLASIVSIAAIVLIGLLLLVGMVAVIRRAVRAQRRYRSLWNPELDAIADKPFAQRAPATHPPNITESLTRLAANPDRVYALLPRRRTG